MVRQAQVTIQNNVAIQQRTDRVDNGILLVVSLHKDRVEGCNTTSRKTALPVR